MKYEIDRDEVLRYLGYAGQSLEDDLSTRIDAIITRCESELTPKSVAAYFDIAATKLDGNKPAIALLDTPLVFEGEDISRRLDGAKSCAVFACTLGAKSEQELARLKATGSLDALIYDAACSALVELAADDVEAEIIAEAHSQKRFTNDRYSPGYGDFPLTVQPQLLKALRAYERIGLTTTETNLLLPTKSVTAVVGIFEQPPTESKSRDCASCHVRDYCRLRASGKVCHG